MYVAIGKWSVPGGLIEGSTSHRIIRSWISSVHQKLSGREYFLVTMCSRVGCPFGNSVAAFLSRLFFVLLIQSAVFIHILRS
jgi:hypothetical protein